MGYYKEVLKNFQPDNETLQKNHFFYFDMGHYFNFSAAPQIWCEIQHIPPIPFITLKFFFCGFYWVVKIELNSIWQCIYIFASGLVKSLLDFKRLSDHLNVSCSDFKFVFFCF